MLYGGRDFNGTPEQHWNPNTPQTWAPQQERAGRGPRAQTVGELQGRGQLEKPTWTLQQILLQGVKGMPWYKIERSHTAVLETGNVKRKGELWGAACSTAQRQGQPRLDKAVFSCSVPGSCSPALPAQQQNREGEKSQQQALPKQHMSHDTACYLNPRHSAKHCSSSHRHTPQEHGTWQEGRHKGRELLEGSISDRDGQGLMSLQALQISAQSPSCRQSLKSDPTAKQATDGKLGFVVEVYEVSFLTIPCWPPI